MFQMARVLRSSEPTSVPRFGFRGSLYTTKPSMPWSFRDCPVAMVVHRTGDAIGFSERSAVRVPRSMSRAKFGSRPSLSSGSMTRNDAPSIPTTSTLNGERAVARARRCSGVSHGFQTASPAAASPIASAPTRTARARIGLSPSRHDRHGTRPRVGLDEAQQLVALLLQRVSTGLAQRREGLDQQAGGALPSLHAPHPRDEA